MSTNQTNENEPEEETTGVFENWNMRCPKCGRDDCLDVTAQVNVRLFPDGTDPGEAEFGDTEWDNDSPCYCAACGHGGTVRDFEGPDDGNG